MYVPFLREISPQNPHVIRPKKLNIKEFLKLIEEIYSYKFDPKSFNTKGGSAPPKKPLKSKSFIDPGSPEIKSL